MSASLKYLQDREWSMGNGQCPDCCRAKPGIGWWTDTVGHREGCPLAVALGELGAAPEMERDNPEKHLDDRPLRGTGGAG